MEGTAGGGTARQVLMDLEVQALDGHRGSDSPALGSAVRVTRLGVGLHEIDQAQPRALTAPPAGPRGRGVTHTPPHSPTH